MPAIVLDVEIEEPTGVVRNAEGNCHRQVSLRRNAKRKTATLY